MDKAGMETVVGTSVNGAVGVWCEHPQYGGQWWAPLFDPGKPYRFETAEEALRQYDALPHEPPWTRAAKPLPPWTRAAKPLPARGDRTSILLASERFPPNLFDRFARARKYMNERRVDVDMCVYEMQPISRAMANIIGYFRTTACEFLLYVDPEIIWHPRSVDRALKAAVLADVVCVGADTIGADERGEGATELVDVQAAASLLVLIRRSAIDKLCERHPELAFDDQERKAFDLFQMAKRGDVLWAEHAAFFARCRLADLSIKLVREKPRATEVDLTWAQGL